MSLLAVAGANSASGGYEVSNSLKLESDNSERLYKTFSSAGNRRTFTISFWVKRTEINGVKQYLFEAGNSDANDDRFTLRFGTGDTFDIQSQNTWLITNRVFRDVAAWYHFLIKVDTTDGTAANRIKLYVNGVEETSFSTDNRSSINQNHDFPVNNTEIHNIGSSPIEGGLYFNGYIAEWHQLDGTASTPSSFGETDDDSGIWKPKEYTGSYGTNGFKLNFDDTSSTGNDSSGNNHDFSDSNLTAADHATDTPTNNFCILNIHDQRSDTPALLTEGGTVHLQDPGSGTGSIRGTFGVNRGKWYWEFKLSLHEGDSFYYLYGVSSLDKNMARYPGQGDGGFSIGVYGQNGNAYFNGSNTAWETSGSGGNNDIIGIYLDLDNDTLKVKKNGTLIGNAHANDIVATLTNASISVNFNKNNYAAAFADGTGSSAYRTKYFVNFGGYCAYTISSGNSDPNGHGNFEYSTNDGTYDYYALCSKNLAEFG